MTHTLDALAALRDGVHYSERDRRPRLLRLDSEGLGITVEVPAPRVLVEVLDLLPDRQAFRRGSSLISRPRGSDLVEDLVPHDLAEEASRLVGLFAALPDRDDAGRPYRDLRTLATVSPDLAAAYALDALRALRSTLSTTPRPPRARRGNTPDADRKRASREQQRRDEEDASRWWLGGYLSGWGDEDEAPAPGSRVAAPALFEGARDALKEVVEEYAEDVTNPDPVSPSGLLSLEERLDEWEARVEDEGLPLRPRVPRRSVFYSLADEALGARSPRSTGGLRFYTIPDTTGGSSMTNLYTEEEISAALEVREIVARLREQEQRLRTPRDTGGRFAPAADGTVVPLDSRRARPSL